MTTLRDVPRVGQGTWQMERDDRREAIAALRAGLDLGLRHIDTAEMYGSGAVESLVGEAIAGRRDEVYLVSKVLPMHATREGTMAAAEASLERLGTDRLDLYLLHWPGHHPLEGTLEAFERLIAQGKIRAWGLSNFDATELEEAKTLAAAQPSLPPMACNQVLYHLGERAIEHAVMPWCAREDVAVVGYSPFGSGAFPTPTSAGGKLLAAIAAAHGASARQVALAFLMRDGATLTIPKAARTDHVVDNAGAFGLQLTPDEVTRLDGAFALGPRPSGLPMI